MNLYDVFRQSVDQRPDHPAVLGPGPNDRLSYRELDEAIQTAAGSLEAAGIGPRNCVGLHLPSGRDYIVWNYAVWKRGGCVVPIPVELKDAEKQQVFHDISLEAVISQRPESRDRSRDRLETEDYRPKAETRNEAVLPFSLQPSAFSLLSLDSRPSTRLAADVVVIPLRAARQHPPGFRAINSAFIRFTSGTTGDSKGIVLSHESILDRIHAANDVLNIGPDDRVIWLLSMSYHFTVSIVGYLSLGATVVLSPNHFADAVIEATERHRGTLIYGSPLHYRLLADSRRDASLSSVRLAVSTASGLDAGTSGKFQQRFGLPVTQALGIIEVGLPCINVAHAGEHSEAVGSVLPAYRIRLQDAGLGEELKEISFGGKGFLDAYYQPWRTRDEIMPDGWFRTGDVGWLDANGCLHLSGRSTDVINVMGMKFFPREVEAVLESHPRVKEACVFARRDPRHGEVPYAQVVPVDCRLDSVSATELLDHCRQRLSAYKIPQRIEFTSALERTASGKIRHPASVSTEATSTAQ